MKLSRLHDSTSVTAETVHIVSPRARTPPLVPTHRGSNEECVLLGLEYCTQTEATHTHTHNHHLSSPPNANRAVTPAALLIEGDSNQRRRSQARLWLRRAAGLNQRKWWRGEQIRVWTGTWQPAAGAEVAQREHRASLWTHFTVHYATATQLHPLHLLPLFLTHSILPFTASVPFN